MNFLENLISQVIVNVLTIILVFTITIITVVLFKEPLIKIYHIFEEYKKQRKKEVLTGKHIKLCKGEAVSLDDKGLKIRFDGLIEDKLFGKFEYYRAIFVLTYNDEYVDEFLAVDGINNLKTKDEKIEIKLDILDKYSGETFFSTWVDICIELKENRLVT